MPGKTLKVSFIFSDNSSMVFAFFHSEGSFNKMIKSQALIPIGSVGISAAPILETIWVTSSGYSFRINFWASSFIFMLCESEAFVCKIISTAKSPSFNSGINSPPNLLKMNRLTVKRSIENPKIIDLLFRAKIDC